MPGLIAFKRRWRIGSDDFVFPGFAELIIRVLWVVVVCVVYAVHQSSFHDHCNRELYLRIYYIGMIVLVILNCAITISVIFVSARGGIMELDRRRHLTKLIYLKLVAYVPEFGWNIFGAYFAFGDPGNCSLYFVNLIRGTSIFGFVAGVAVLVGIAVVFDPLGTRRGPRSESRLVIDDHQSVWKRRCRIICCCVGKDPFQQEAFDDISEILAEFFQDVDLVATDIAAGLVLLQQEQESLTNTRELETENDATLPEWMKSKQLEYYMKYAMCPYGWPLFMFMNLGTGLCKLWSDIRCCTCCCTQGQHHTHVLADNCCTCNVAAIKKFTGAKSEDIIYANFQNQLYETPFCVILDHQTKSIVISIRGTLSLKDALTDMTAEGECLYLDGFKEQDSIAHKGILQAAKYVHETLQREQILVKLKQSYPEYRLVITGHSLGAGTAALLAILIKPRFPELICYSFSPPGGLMSLPVSKYCQDFICSVVLGRDLIPRLGLKTVDNLKERLLNQLDRSKTPKYRILAKAMWSCVFGSCCNNQSDEPLPTASDSPLLRNKHAAKYGDERTVADTANTDDNRLTEVSLGLDGPPLFPPGRVLHICKTDRELSGDFTSSWKPAESFNEILVGPEMIFDHLPDVVYSALKCLNNVETNEQVAV
ncbi:diacylglycerol lipase-beta-like [Tubulanus polymorphus]|uniref:diacylglycerol lipase-beta-like n=1 Tax=Tubulanus polymorphus TaxID=672921 RepID=UPI003DA4DD97